MSLNLCPFCGAMNNITVEINPHYWDTGMQDFYAVHCHECTTFGPYKSSREEAVSAWNERAFSWSGK
jgi:Lar family restriction alleviation protein